MGKRKNKTVSWIKTLQQQNGMMIWSVNESSSEMSPKQILIKESTCKGIHLLYAGTGKKPSL